ncbi:hypothetical protein HZS_2494 [Henneguya salminicola]|nr:hypothetical protein HZS_2494 [Henneguya salminicola]
MLKITLKNIFSLHKITLSVVKNDLWCQQNEVTPSHELNTTDYENYLSSISPQPDALVVLEYVFIIDELYNTLCRRSNLNPKRAGETLAHELGHSLGLIDIKESDHSCKCGSPGLSFCLMFWRENIW